MLEVNLYGDEVVVEEHADDVADIVMKTPLHRAFANQGGHTKNCAIAEREETIQDMVEEEVDHRLYHLLLFG
jgi:hypothetical protein